MSLMNRVLTPGGGERRKKGKSTSKSFQNHLSLELKKTNQTIEEMVISILYLILKIFNSLDPNSCIGFNKNSLF